MITVVTGGNEAINAFIYGVESNQGTLNFLRNQVMNFSQNVTEAGQQFFARGQQIFEQFNGAEAVRLARAALSKVSNILKPDIIWQMKTIEDVQSANFMMQRFVMAMPEIRQLHIEQRIDGYSESYFNPWPNDVGVMHQDYRMVMTGMEQESEDGESTFVTYFDELSEGDRALTFDEKIEIRSVWDMLRPQLEAGSPDPTSIFGTKIN